MGNALKGRINFRKNKKDVRPSRTDNDDSTIESTTPSRNQNDQPIANKPNRARGLDAPASDTAIVPPVNRGADSNRARPTS
jgi:hypothetical protein